MDGEVLPDPVERAPKGAARFGMVGLYGPQKKGVDVIET